MRKLILTVLLLFAVFMFITSYSGRKPHHAQGETVRHL